VPNLARAHLNRGNALLAMGDVEGALAACATALVHDPEYAAAHFNMGNAYLRQSRREAALAAYDKAIALKPDFVDAEVARGNVLDDLGKLDDAEESYRRALKLNPEYVEAYSNLLFSHNYRANLSASALLSEAQRYGEVVARPARYCPDWHNVPDAFRCLRVGFVSGDLRQHPVGHFFEGVLAALAQHAVGRLEFFAYVSYFGGDEVTERIKAHCHGWCSAVGLSDESLAQRIRDDGIDILIDLSGHTAHNRLPVFAWKPAPIQSTWLGYFATTGVAAIDYLIADPWTLPASEEVNFTETIWRLPETRLCFTPPDISLEVTPLPAISNGHIVFACFNNLSKMNDAVVALWARILNAVPGSRIFLKALQLAEASVRQSVVQRFAVHGISAERLILEGFSSRAEYLATYQRVDIGLDPFPYTGGTTTVEALWMGVPVLTLSGKSFLSRQGVGLLMNAGLPEWIAEDVDDYVARAVSQTSDLPRLAALRSGLRQQVLASPVFNATRFAQNFEAALRGMWQAWCDQQQIGIAGGARREADTAERDAPGLIEQGNAFEDDGLLEQALECYESAIRLEPTLARAHLNRGNILLETGDADGALAAYATALVLEPDYAAAHYNTGNAYLRSDRREAALAAYDKAIELKPDFVDAEVARSNVLKDLGRRDDAVASYRRLLKITPDSAELHIDLGNALQGLARHEEAAASYRRALEIRPDSAETYNNLGIVLQALERFDEAVVSLRRALELKPDLAPAHNNLGNALQELGQLDQAAACIRRALELKPDFAAVHSSLLFVHHYLVGQPVSLMREEAVRYGELVARQLCPSARWDIAPDPARRLRVGFVSGDLRQHPIGNFLEGVFASLVSEANGRLEVFAYANHLCCDEVAERIKAHCQAWHWVAGMEDESLAQRIRDDGIDILIDLSGHTAHNRLPMFAWKPAPVQATWLGYLATTGVSAIDYVIADDWTFPASEEENFTEKVWRLPGSYLCFTPPSDAVDVGPLPAISKGYITFGSFNNLSKMNDDVVALWSRVLVAVPNSRLFLKAKLFKETSVRQSVMERFAARGIAADRLILEGRVPRVDYLRPFQRVDIALDPFPYPGITTSVENLWMGVPVLTLAGKRFLSRQGVGLLMNAGLPEWIAETEDDYVFRAVSRANDLKALSSLRSELRQRVLASPIFDAPRFAQHFEAALRGMWQKWCEQQRSSLS
jgi:predicted O-linked N-acetylglucosamine transferase (SPINDLY family)